MVQSTLIRTMSPASTQGRERPRAWWARIFPVRVIGFAAAMAAAKLANGLYAVNEGVSGGRRPPDGRPTGGGTPTEAGSLPDRHLEGAPGGKPALVGHQDLVLAGHRGPPDRL